MSDQELRMLGSLLCQYRIEHGSTKTDDAVTKLQHTVNRILGRRKAQDRREVYGY